LPPDALLEINYEDIVRGQEAASRKMIAFLGLPWDDEVLRFHESPVPSATASAVQVRRPVYASSGRQMAAPRSSPHANAFAVGA
jgi:Sulfotransferase family